MRLRLAVFVIILGLSLISAGCWNEREIDKLAFVLGIALDKTDNDKVKVTVQIANPSTVSKSPAGGGQKNKPFWVTSSEGKTFFEAIRKMATFSSRRIYWPHNKIIIIGEKLAKSDILEILDFFSRNPELRLRTWVAVVPGEAGPILEKAPIMEQDPATSIENVMMQRVWTGKSYGTMLKDFLEDYLDPDTYPVASRILPGENPSEHIKLTGSAVFDKDRMVDWLDEQETQGLIWLKGERQNSIMVVPCPFDGKPLSVEIIGSKIDHQSQFKADKPYFNIEVKATGNLSEQACRTDFTKFPNQQKLEEALASSIKDDIQVTIRAAQYHLRLDFLGFGQVFHQQHKREWKIVQKKWSRLFPQMTINLTVKGNIPRETLFARPLTLNNIGKMN